MAEFRIDVVVDPSKAVPIVDGLRKSLDGTAQAADALRVQLAKALSVTEAPASKTLQRIAETLDGIAARAIVTDARISQLGKDVRADGLKKVNDELDKTKDKAQTVNGLLKSAFAVIGTAIAIREFVDLSDTLANVQNRLRLVTSGEKELQDTTAALFGIAERTRQSFEGTAEIFNRLAVGAKQLGRSNQELLQFTESLNQALALSGASADEARRGIIQLAQGMATGTLRGQDLNSVLSQIPAVADVIAKQLGVTRGELKNLGAQGKITAEVILDAFKNARQELADRFATTVPTIGQSFENLHTALIQLVGDFNKTTLASTLFAVSLDFIAKNLPAITTVLVALAGVIGVQLAARAIPAFIESLGGLVPALATAGTAVATFGAVVAGAFVTKVIIDFIDELNEAKAIAAGFGQQKLIDPLVLEQVKAVNRLIEGYSKQLREGTIDTEFAKKRIAELTEQKKQLADQVKSTVAALNEESGALTGQREAVKKAISDLEEQNRVLRLNSTERKVATELQKEVTALQHQGVTVTDAIKAELETRIRANQQLRDSVSLVESLRTPQERQIKDLEDLERAYKEKVIPTVEEYEKLRARLVNKDSPSLKGALGGSELNKLLEQLKAVEDQFNKTGQVGSGTVNALADALVRATSASTNLREQLFLIRFQLKDSPVAAQAYEDALNKLLGKKPDEALREQLDNLQLKLEKGRITVFEYQQSIIDLQIKSKQATGDLASGFEIAFLRIKKEAEDLSVVGEKVVTAFADRASEALANFAINGKFSIKEFARAFLADLTRILARLLVIQAINAAIGGGAPAGYGVASGGYSGAQNSLFSEELSGARAGGGPVTAGRSYVVGEKGPEIFRPDTNGSIQPNGAVAEQKAPIVQVINVTDPNEIPAHIASGKADDAIINAIARNPQKVNRALGSA